MSELVAEEMGFGWDGTLHPLHKVQAQLRFSLNHSFGKKWEFEDQFQGISVSVLKLGLGS